MIMVSHFEIKKKWFSHKNLFQMSDKLVSQIGFRVGEVSIKVNKLNFLQVHSQEREVSH